MRLPIARVHLAVGLFFSLAACSGASAPTQSPGFARDGVTQAARQRRVLPVSERAAGKFRYGLPQLGGVRVLRPASRKFHQSYVFVGDQINDAVYVADAVNGVSTGTVDMPLPVWGLATDPATGNVYVGIGAMGVSGGEIVILNPKGTEQLGLLTDSGCCGYALAVQRGEVYVSNWTGTCGPSTIDIFPTTQMTGNPASTVTEPNQLVYGLSSDGKNLYAQGFNLTCSASVIDESGDGGTSWHAYPASGVSGYPGGLANAKKGLFFVDDQNGQLYEYQNPTAHQITSDGYVDISKQNPLDYTAIAMGLDDTDIWAANVNYGCGQSLCSDGQDQVLRYLQLTAATSNIYAESLGIAVSPAGKE